MTEKILTSEDGGTTSTLSRTNDESQALTTNNHSKNLEINELQQKNLAITATVLRLEQLIATIQRNSTTTQTTLRDTI
jgi:hypothetical protein